MKQLAKYKRQPEKIPFVLTDRDALILDALNNYRYLKTGQIQSLFFAKNSTLQSVRRRLKHLYHHKYVGRVLPYIKFGANLPETAYYLETEGENYLKDQGVEVKLWRRSKHVKQQFLQHALELSEFRILWETAVKSEERLSVHEFNII